MMCSGEMRVLFTASDVDRWGCYSQPVMCSGEMGVLFTASDVQWIDGSVIYSQ